MKTFTEYLLQTDLYEDDLNHLIEVFLSTIIEHRQDLLHKLKYA